MSGPFLLLPVAAQVKETLPWPACPHYKLIYPAAVTFIH